MRLRITCDDKYPMIRRRIIHSIGFVLPHNKVSTIRRSGCTDVSCYSNQLENILGWSAIGGSKFLQNVHVPNWIISSERASRFCLKGLFETDGSVYYDRKYIQANFTTIISDLAHDVLNMVCALGFHPNLQQITENGKKDKYVIRISRNAKKFINDIMIDKR